MKQVGKTRCEGNYQIGNWVSLDKEPRSGLSKIDAVQYGPFKVVGCCKKWPVNYHLLYLAILGSNKLAHTKHLRIWPGIGEKVDSGEYCGRPFVAGPRPGPKVSGFLKYIRKALKFRREVTIEPFRKARGSVLGGITCVQEMEVCNRGRP